MSKNYSPYISVDCVIFGFDSKQLNVLLMERTLLDDNTGDLVFTDHTLIGNHIYEHENLDDAAERILFELTGLQNIYLQQFGSFCNPGRLLNPLDQLWLKVNGRDTQERIITTAYFSLLNNQNITLTWKGRNVRWCPVSEIVQLGFDHKDIVDAALQQLRRSVLDEPIGYELLPNKFTLSQLQTLYEAILGAELDKRNFRKKVSRMKYLIQLDEKQTGVSHKPANLFIFSREVYEKTKKEQISFNV